MLRFYLFLALGFWYLGSRLYPGLGNLIWPVLMFLFAGVLLFPTRWLRKSKLGPWQHLLRWKVYLDIGFLVLLTSITVLRDLIFLFLSLIGSSWSVYHLSVESTALVFGLTLFSLSLGIWSARSGPRIKNVKVPIKDLPPSLEGYRIAQISDLHIGPTIGTKYVQKVVRKVNSLQPHLTVLTGDIVDGEADHHLSAATHLSQLEPAGQVMMVTGNHEYYWDGPRWIREFQSLGVNVLLNSQKRIKHKEHEILIAGVLDPAAAIADPQHKPDLLAALGENSKSTVKILLAHQPNIAPYAAEVGFDLLLSGHTHAGQFFPFTLFIFSVQKFVKGLNTCGKMWVYVNQGTGYWGPPIRLGTVTEITLLELTVARSPNEAHGRKPDPSISR